MLNKELSVNETAYKETIQNMYQDKLKNDVQFYGKTGSGQQKRNTNGDQKGNKRDGWYIGFVEKSNKQYVYVSKISDKINPTNKDVLYGGPVAKEIAINIINEYFEEIK